MHQSQLSNVSRNGVGDQWPGAYKVRKETLENKEKTAGKKEKEGKEETDKPRRADTAEKTEEKRDTKGKEETEKPRHADTPKLTTPPRFHAPKSEWGEGVGWEATKSWDQRLYGVDLKEEQARRWEFGVCACVCEREREGERESLGVCVCVQVCV